MQTLELTEEKLTPKSTKNISGSVAVLEALIAENVKTIFGYPVVLLCLFTMRYMIITIS